MIYKREFESSREEDCLAMISEAIEDDKIINIIPSVRKIPGYFCNEIHRYVVFYKD